MLCFRLDMTVPQTVQAHPGTDIVYILFFFRNAVQVVQTQCYNIQPTVHPEILTDFLCL